MGVPGFLLRKLYARGSLRQDDDATFSFAMRNPLADAHLISAPRITVNGIHYDADDVDAGPGLDLASIGPDAPFLFRKGSTLTLRFHGRLLKGGSRIHVRVDTEEFGDIDFLVEDKPADP